LYRTVALILEIDGVERTIAGISMLQLVPYRARQLFTEMTGPQR